MKFIVSCPKEECTYKNKPKYINPQCVPREVGPTDAYIKALIKTFNFKCCYCGSDISDIRLVKEEV